MEEKKIVKPVRFLNEEDTKKEPEKEEKEDADLVLNCKYGNLKLKLSKIPFIRDLF